MARYGTNLGMTLGQAIAGGTNGNGDEFERGANAGARVNHYNADTALKRRQLDLQSDDNIMNSALIGAGSNTGLAPALKRFLTTGSFDFPATEQDSMLAAQGVGIEPPPPVRQASVDDQRQMRAAAPMVAALRNMLMAGDSNSLNPAKAAPIIQTAAGNGNDAASLAALLAHGKTQYDPAANGVTNILNGEQTLNQYGESQIRANDANVVARKASANNSNAKADGGGTATALEKNARLLINTGMATDMQDAIKKLNGRSVKTDGLGNIILVDKYDNSIISVSGNGKQKTIVEGDTMPPPRTGSKAQPSDETPDSIRAAFKAGKMTRAQAEEALKKHGFK